MRIPDLLRTSLPDLLQPSDSRYYTDSPEPKGGWPDRATPDRLRRSLDKAHDNLRSLVRENDHLRRALIELNRKQRWQLKIFIALLGFTWSILGAIVKLLLPYVLHSMAR